MNKTNKNLLALLRNLGLDSDEAAIYTELLKEDNTHQELSRITGINRTKVYRIVDDLEKKSLVRNVTDDRGTFLVAAEPQSLEMVVVESENTFKNTKASYAAALPILNSIHSTYGSDDLDFDIHTYDGEEGMKQMLWNELKAHEEIISFGYGALEDMVKSKRWAEKHRQKIIENDICMRELINPGEKPTDFTKNKAFYDIYEQRRIEESLLPLDQRVVVYNNTVAMYHHKDRRLSGVEIVNKAYAETMRAMFENYWRMADK